MVKTNRYAGEMEFRYYYKKIEEKWRKMELF